MRNFTDIARPLTDQPKKNVVLVWGSEQASAFAKLTMRLTSPPTFGHFEISAPTEVRTGASSLGIGTVLAQQQHSSERVIAYSSGLLVLAKRNYSITERECLALIWAVGKFSYICIDHHSPLSRTTTPYSGCHC